VIYNDGPTTITVVATDAVGVTRVSLSWAGGASGTVDMAPSGGAWGFTFSSDSPNPSSLTFTAVAYDAAGNPSPPASVAVDWQYFG